MNGEQKAWSIVSICVAATLISLIAGVTYYNVKITEEAIKAGLHQTRTTSGATIWTKPLPIRYALVDETGNVVEPNSPQ